MPKRCFFIMPFAPGHRYFYLYVKQHIETRHDFECHRVDDVPHFTQAIIDQIQDEIRDADIIIADVSGGNPNVFYELGLAHALDKFVLLVTQDDYDKLPFDIEGLRVLSYRNAENFLTELDQILIARFSPQHYGALYAQAQDLFERVRADLRLDITLIPRDRFISTLQDLEHRRLWSYTDVQDNASKLADFLLSLVIEERHVPEIRQQVDEWLLDHYGAQD